MTSDWFGARVNGDGATFRLWAPAARSVDLVLDRPIALQQEHAGWYEATIPGVASGARYQYRIDGDLLVPDPASGFQPDDVFGPSEVIDHSTFKWRAAGWRSRPWREAVILEAHVGTFTREGTFLAMVDRLDHLADAGITALELMPLNDFPGRRNWGYDGVLWYAPDSHYGRPEDLKTLIDEAHLRGLMVFLDVVYNHFGPEGNYLGRYAPSFFDPASKTPWGGAINYDKEEVRAFAIQNALHWLETYRFDGLRLDAVQAIGRPPRALLRDISLAVGKLARRTQREIHLMLENDENEASLLDPTTDPPEGRCRAQWNDDFHHAWHVALTGENAGYYRDYTDNPLRHLGRTLSAGFAYQGEQSAHRNGNPRGEASGDLSPLAFINFLQNHDQIGNRPLGDRLTRLADRKAIEAALTITLLAPMPPMLFMGEEWGSEQPFPFFCDFLSEDLAEAVRQGRRHEFKAAYARYGSAVPDPLDEATFRSAKLDWEHCDEEPFHSRLALVSQLLHIRQRELVPLFDRVSFGSADPTQTPVISARYRLDRNKTLSLLANASGDPQPRPFLHDAGVPIWGGPTPEQLPPWAVFWRLG